VETLFGHQDNVVSVAAMAIDQCVSVGARDRTARWWKVVDETQLVFRGGSSKHAEYHDNNLDCVAVIPPSHFVTGSDSGSLSLWSVHKKKPLYTIPLAHGLDPLPPLEDLSSEIDKEIAGKNSRFLRRMPRWITALTTVPGTDIILSGSWDGWIRAWRISEDKKVIYSLGPVGGGPSSPVASPSLQLQQTLTTNGVSAPGATVLDHSPPRDALTTGKSNEPEPLLKGVVNDIAVYERRPITAKPGHQNLTSSSGPTSMPSDSQHKKGTPEGQRSITPGLCIVAALGKEHRFGRWKCFSNGSNKNKSSSSNSNSSNSAGSKGRNGAVVFEVSFYSESAIQSIDT
jgi:ribosomal RNA-processing protein 9